MFFLFSHMHTQMNCANFLVLPVSRKVRGKPSFAKISFYVSVYTFCNLQSCSIVFTSFPHWRSHFLLHCVTLPWGTFLKLCEICAACVCMHAHMHACTSMVLQETVLHTPTIFLRACEFAMHQTRIASVRLKSSCKRLQGLILNDFLILALSQEVISS